jgi:hypothetical protein
MEVIKYAVLVVLVIGFLGIPFVIDYYVGKKSK